MPNISNSTAKRLFKKLDLASVLAIGLVPAASAQIAANPPRNMPVTCFTGQDPSAFADQAAQSTVGLALVNANGHSTDIGSGFIVKNSGSPDNPHNRIVTAEHVQAPPGGFIVALASDGSSIGVLTVLETASNIIVLAVKKSASGTFAKYDSLPGLDLGKQDASGYLTGIFADPAGITEGNSGGPIIDGKGKVVALVQSVLGSTRAKITIQAPRIEHPFKPDTHALDKQPLALDTPDRVYATSLADSRIRKALNQAGHDAILVPALSDTPVIAYGVPHHGCVVTTGAVRQLDFNALDDFELATVPLSPVLPFAYWSDSKLAGDELKSLISEAQTIAPTNQTIILLNRMIGGESELEKMHIARMPRALIDLANSIPDPVLAQRLADAAYNIDAFRYRSDLLASFGGRNFRPAIFEPDSK